jgi:HSP20 family protein
MKDKDRLPLVLQSPFALMRRLTGDMERMFDDFDIRRPLTFQPAARPVDWLPPVEILQDDKQMIVRAELPGLKKEDVKIEVLEDHLTIEGERKQEKEETREGYVRTERSYGTFFRSIPLPEGAQADNAKATFKDGVLEVDIPVAVKKPVAGRRLVIEGPQEKEKKELVGV